MGQVLARYLGKKIKIVLNFPNQPIFYCGVLREIEDNFIVVDEIRKGEMIIAIDDITTIHEVQ